MSDSCDTPPANVHNKPFYITLTPTASAANIINDDGKKEYEILLSDFTTIFSSQIQLNPYKKWSIALTDAFIPIDTRMSAIDDSIKDNWFKYGYGLENKIFPGKNFFYPSTDTEEFNEFAKTYNNLMLQNRLSLVGLDSIIEVGVVDEKITKEIERHGCMYIKLKQDLKVNCIIKLTLPKSLYRRFVGTDDLIGFFSYDRGTPIYHVYCSWDYDGEDMTCMINSNIELKKSLCFISPYKISEKQANNNDRLINIECSVLESTRVGGVSGRILRTILNRNGDLNSSIDETKRLVFLPIELHEFQTIRVRILNYETDLPIKYDYDTAVGRPFITARLEPRYG